MKIFSGKPQMLKEVNSSMIEQLVFENGPLSKPELSKKTGLSLPTISKLVDDLEKNSRLSSIGRSGTGAGRRAMLYEINRNSGCILACYYKEGSYLCRLADMQNHTIHEKNFPLDPASLISALDSTVQAIEFLMEQASTPVKIIGIGLPGVVQPDGRLLGIPQIAVWEGFNLEEALRGKYKATVYVENQVKLSAMGYYYTNLRETRDNMVYLYVGNGIGSGIILNNHLYKGSDYFAGEIAYMTDKDSKEGRNYVAGGGYMESLMNPLVDYITGELRYKDNPAKLKELTSILASICVNYVTMVNPGVIVLSGILFNKSVAQAISQRMACYLPAEVLPEIIIDENSTTGLEGLIQSCRLYITAGIHLVQGAGLPQNSL